jgi:hypothetical protein
MCCWLYIEKIFVTYPHTTHALSSKVWQRHLRSQILKCWYESVSLLYYACYIHRRLMWRSSGNTRLLRKRSRVRFPHNANICVREHVCLYWVWVFLCIMYVFAKKYVYKCSGCIIALHKQSGSSNREMHISEKYYNVNNDWRNVTLRHANLNRANRVYRADQYIYKFQQLIVRPRSPSEHQLGGRSSLFVDTVANTPMIYKKLL